MPLLERKVAELESVIQLLQAENEHQAKQLVRGSHRAGHVQAVAETATDQVKYMQQQLADSQAAFQQCQMELDSVSQSCVLSSSVFHRYLLLIVSKRPSDAPSSSNKRQNDDSIFLHTCCVWRHTQLTLRQSTCSPPAFHFVCMQSSRFTLE